jgi:hypothetical protein
MGFMDFLKKKSDLGTGTEGLNFDSTMPSDMNNGLQQPGFGTEFQQSNLNPSMSMNDMGSSTFGQSAMHQNTMPQQHDSNLEKDIQMISLKLDAIKSELDSVNQRLKNIESIAEREQQAKSVKKWY